MKKKGDKQTINEAEREENSRTYERQLSSWRMFLLFVGF